MTRVVIIGGHGFVGRAIAGHLAARAPAVEATALTKAAFDLTSPDSWGSLAFGVDCVVHAAMYDLGDRYEIFNVNALSAGPLGEHLNQISVGKLVYLSTGAVYGNASAPATPATPCDPKTDYALSKYLAEQKLAAQFSGRLSILRIYFPYGPRQREPRLVPSLIRRIAAGERIVCNPDGGPRQPLAHIDDLTRHIVEDFVIGDSEVKVCNIASDRILSIEQLARWIGEALGCEVVFDRGGTSSDVGSEPYAPGTWRDFTLEGMLP